MEQRSAEWYRNVAIGGAVLSLVMVVAMELLQHARLSQWLHIPLTLVVLNLMAAGAGAAGVAYLEYQGRSAGSGQQA